MKTNPSILCRNGFLALLSIVGFKRTLNFPFIVSPFSEQQTTLSVRNSFCVLMISTDAQSVDVHICIQISFEPKPCDELKSSLSIKIVYKRINV